MFLPPPSDLFAVGGCILQPVCRSRVLARSATLRVAAFAFAIVDSKEWQNRPSPVGVSEGVPKTAILCFPGMMPHVNEAKGIATKPKDTKLVSNWSYFCPLTTAGGNS